MLVVGIIGILYSVAAPKMEIFVAKSRRVEASNMLRQVNTLQSSFHAENNVYSQLWSELGVAQESLEGKRYMAPQLKPVGLGGTSYHAVTGIKDGQSLCTGVTQDTWVVGMCGSGDPLCQMIMDGAGMSADELFSGKPVPLNPTFSCQR